MREEEREREGERERVREIRPPSPLTPLSHIDVAVFRHNNSSGKMAAVVRPSSPSPFSSSSASFVTVSAEGFATLNGKKAVQRRPGGMKDGRKEGRKGVKEEEEGRADGQTDRRRDKCIKARLEIGGGVRG